jgi:hypothetical protein
MSNPRDIVPKFGLPYDYETGLLLTDHQIARIERIKEVHRMVLAVLHDCEGSAPGNPTFNSERMRQAAGWLEMSLMLAKKGALENP